MHVKGRSANRHNRIHQKKQKRKKQEENIKRRGKKQNYYYYSNQIGQRISFKVEIVSIASNGTSVSNIIRDDSVSNGIFFLSLTQNSVIIVYIGYWLLPNTIFTSGNRKSRILNERTETEACKSLRKKDRVSSRIGRGGKSNAK